MPPELYKVLHVLGLFLVFAAIGGAIVQTVLGGGNGRGRKLIAIAHGVGLVIVLVSGFGALAKLGLGLPAWAWVKLVIWLVFGGVVVVIRKQPALAGFLWWALPVLGAFAGYLAIYKPF